jgi:DNA-binding NarL/FixJ family response regulator
VNYQIFVVEDHPSMRAAYAILINAQPDLKLCGEASTAEDALESIPNMRPDLVLVDISLPGMSGLDLLKQLNVRFPDVPALIVSGHDRDLYTNSSLTNAKGYIMKHEGPEVLLSAIRRVLSKEQ